MAQLTFIPVVIPYPPSVGIFIELDDGKIYRKDLYLMVKTMVSCRFSLKPIHWNFNPGWSGYIRCVVSLFVFPAEWCSALWWLALFRHRLSREKIHGLNNHQQVVAFWDGFKSKQKSFPVGFQKSCWIHQFRCLMIRSRWKFPRKSWDLTSTDLWVYDRHQCVFQL